MPHSDSPPPKSVPGTRIAGKYRVVRAIASGGMSDVVLVEHEMLGQRAAIKLLRSDEPSAEAVERFIREARAAASLHSDHVVRVFDIGTIEDGTPYLVMEYLEGRDLAAELALQGRLPAQAAVAFLLQAIDAVAEAHERGVIHRDLKPSNLFLADKPGAARRLKVLDFGISKIVPSAGHFPAADVTGDNALLGSPAYMSPEQIKTPRDVDARTDVWSLGAVLHEMITGQPAFPGNTLGVILHRILTEDPPAPSSLAADVPTALDAVVQRCLAREREQRYPTVLALRDALLPFAVADDRGSPLTTPPPPGEGPEAPAFHLVETMAESAVDLPGATTIETTAPIEWSPYPTYDDDVCSIRIHRVIIAVVWRKAPTFDTITRPAAMMVRILRQVAHPVVFVNIIPADLDPPDHAARAAIEERGHTFDAVPIACVLAVVLGSGFRAAATRSALAGLSFTARSSKVPIAFVGSTREASNLVVKHWPEEAGPAPKRADIASALDEVAALSGLGS